MRVYQIIPGGNIEYYTATFTTDWLDTKSISGDFSLSLVLAQKAGSADIALIPEHCNTPNVQVSNLPNDNSPGGTYGAGEGLGGVLSDDWSAVINVQRSQAKRYIRLKGTMANPSTPNFMLCGLIIAMPEEARIST